MFASGVHIYLHYCPIYMHILKDFMCNHVHNINRINIYQHSTQLFYQSCMIFQISQICLSLKASLKEIFTNTLLLVKPKVYNLFIN
jgi:hypothetical protein